MIFKNRRQVFKVLVLGAGALMTMGNQKCEQKPVRNLKKIVEVSSLTSSPILLPDGKVFDFEVVAHQQLTSVLMDSKEFAFRYQAPLVAPPKKDVVVADGDEGFFNFTKADGLAMKAFSKTVSAAAKEADSSSDAWCMVNLPQARIGGSVNSFEIVGGGGVTIGFNPAGAYSTGGLTSLGLNVQWAQLDLSMRALRPLTSKVMAAANITSKQTKTKVNFALNFGTISAGPSAYYETPLAKVTKTALTKAVDSLSKQLQAEEWSTRVLANQDGHLVVVGGVDVGLEVGDELLVYNEEYFWDGEPCSSNYLGGGAAAGEAVAKIQIDWVGDEVSRGKVIADNYENAVIGAKVKLFKYHDPDFSPEEPGVQPVNLGSEGSSGQSSSVVAENSSKPFRR